MFPWWIWIFYFANFVAYLFLFLTISQVNISLIKLWYIYFLWYILHFLAWIWLWPIDISVRIIATFNFWDIYLYSSDDFLSNYSYLNGQWCIVRLMLSDTFIIKKITVMLDTIVLAVFYCVFFICENVWFWKHSVSPSFTIFRLFLVFKWFPWTSCLCANSIFPVLQ